LERITTFATTIASWKILTKYEVFMAALDRRQLQKNNKMKDFKALFFENLCQCYNIKKSR